VSDYRLAKPVLVRLVGAYVVLLALVLLAVTGVVVLADASADALVLVLGIGVLGGLALAWWLRTRSVVRLGETGYRVRLARGVGVAEARWTDVEDVVAASPRDIDCVVVRLRDGRTTTIPVQLVAADKDDFAHDVRRHLEAAH
jgi:hypothetical protein